MADSLAINPKPSYRVMDHRVLESQLPLWLQRSAHITGYCFHQRLAWPSVTGWVPRKPSMRWRLVCRRLTGDCSQHHPLWKE